MEGGHSEVSSPDGCLTPFCWFVVDAATVAVASASAWRPGKDKQSNLYMHRAHIVSRAGCGLESGMCFRGKYWDLQQGRGHKYLGCHAMRAGPGHKYTINRLILRVCILPSCLMYQSHGSGIRKRVCPISIVTRNGSLISGRYRGNQKSIKKLTAHVEKAADRLLLKLAPSSAPLHLARKQNSFHL